MTDAKTCTKCRQVKAVSEFATDNAKADGLRSNCKSCARATRVAYETANRSLVLERGRAYVRDPETVRQKAARRRATDVERAREDSRRHRARRFGADLGPIDAEAVWQRDGGRCQLCGEPVSRDVAWPAWGSPSIDHVLPLTRGGLHVMENVTLAHLGCNKSKGNRIA